MGKAHLVLLAQDSAWNLRLWRSALLSQSLKVIVVPSEAPLTEYLNEQERKYPVRMLVLDLRVLSREGTSLANFAAWFTRKFPALELVLTTDAKFDITAAERGWARKHGAADLLPALSPLLAEVSAPGVVLRLLATLGIAEVDAKDLRRLLGAAAPLLPQYGGRIDAQANAHALAHRLRDEGQDLAQLARELGAGVRATQRQYLGKSYANCFLGSEACAWLANRLRCDRAAAVAIGQALLVSGYLHHVVKAQPFADGDYFYRYVEDISVIDAIDLDQVASGMQVASGLIAARSYRGTSYPACFVGHEAVDWLCRQHALTREQAVNLGQRLQDLRVLQHVTDEHDFIDDYFFYRFCAPA